MESELCISKELRDGVDDPISLIPVGNKEYILVNKRTVQRVCGHYLTLKQFKQNTIDTPSRVQTERDLCYKCSRIKMTFGPSNQQEIERISQLKKDEYDLAVQKFLSKMGRKETISFQQALGPDVQLGDFIGRGISGIVFSLKSDPKKVIKIIPLKHNLNYLLLRDQVIKEMGIVTLMSRINIAPCVYASWISNNVRVPGRNNENDAGDKSHKIDEHINFFSSQVMDVCSFAFIISERMSVTLKDFLDTSKRIDNNFTTEIKKKFQALKTGLLKHGYFNHDIHSENLMLNLKRTANSNEVKPIVDSLRIIDFGKVDSIWRDTINNGMETETLKCIQRIIQLNPKHYSDERDFWKKLYEEKYKLSELISRENLDIKLFFIDDMESKFERVEKEILNKEKELEMMTL